MIMLSESEAWGRMSLELAFEAVTQALICASDGSGAVLPVVMGSGVNQGEVFGIKAGVAPGRGIMGLKVGSYWPGNDKRGLSRHGSTIVLLDAATGRARAVVEASQLNGPRTAAADAVAACALARPASRVLSIIGAGHQARYEAQALSAKFPDLERIFIVDRTPDAAARLVDWLQGEVSAVVRAATAEVACREADILITVTSATAPLFNAEWLKPGTHVASMGSDQLGKQELPVELLRSARLFCDLPSQSTAIGEFQHVRGGVEAGEITLTAIGDVLRGVAIGRRTEAEITVFDSSGLALQDLFVADRLVGGK